MRRWPWPTGSAIPVLVRPSYVLGGRAMEIVYDDASLRTYFERAARVAPEHPVLIDRFLEDAFEADVDAISDGTSCVSAASCSTSRTPASTRATRPASCRPT